MSVCTATTTRGRRCRNPAAAGSDRCRLHRDAPSAEAVESFLNAVRSGSYLEIAAAHVGASGLLKFRWAQATTTAGSPTIVYTGSVLRYRQLA